MKRIIKLSLILGLVILVAVCAGGYMAYRQFVGTDTFDEELYAAEGGEDAKFSYDSYASVLKEHVDEKGMVAYAELKAKPAELERFARGLGSLDAKVYEGWDEPAKIAFWINAYNGLTLKVIIDNYPIKKGLLSGLTYPANSIRQIPGVWDKVQFLVMGRRMTLNEIEHKMLRVKFDEPRIHVALVCAAMGCPQLRNEPFISEKLDEQLKDQSRRFLADAVKFRIDREAGEVHLSSIFKWFGKDFIKKHKPEAGFGSGGSDAEKAVFNFIGQYVGAEEAEYLRTGTYKVKYLSYDWTLNEQKDDENHGSP